MRTKTFGRMFVHPDDRPTLVPPNTVQESQETDELRQLISEQQATKPQRS